MEVGNLVALEQLGHSAGQLFHDTILTGDHRGDIHGGVFYADAMGAVVVLQMMVVLAGVQQCLGRYAPHVETGSAG